MRFYAHTKRDELRMALHNFVPHNDKNLKAAVIPTDLYLARGIVIHAVQCFYDGPSPPETGPFAELLKVPSLFSSTKSQGYAQLVSQLRNRRSLD